MPPRRLLGTLATTLASLTVLAALLAQPGHAACGGTDLHPTLRPGERTMLAAELAATPHATGNHWRATRGDLAIHLVGTFHLDDPRHDTTMARLAPMLRRAGLILLEMTPAEQRALRQALAERPELLFLTGPTLIELLPEDEWRELAEAARLRGIPPFMAAKFQPWYLAMMLSMPPCVTAELSGGTGGNGLDARIMDFAEEHDIPMRALEPYDTMFRLFSGEPLDSQIDMMAGGVMSPRAAEDALATMAAAYFRQDHGAVWALNRIVAQRASDIPADQLDAALEKFRTLALTERNRVWLPVILQAAQDAAPRPLVVAAGAGHLGGADGMLRLLEDEGFELERLPF